MGWLRQSLPQAMYDTSEGLVDKQPNPLLSYYAANARGGNFSQLVIDNWNIILGQKPLRLSIRYFKMREAGGDSLSGVIEADTLIRDQKQPVVIDNVGQPHGKFEEAKTIDDIVGVRTRAAVGRHCEYTLAYGRVTDVPGKKTEGNGFACMLSVDRAETQLILDDLYQSNFITNQTATLALDFVIYNGYAEAFAHVAIVRFSAQRQGVEKLVCANRPA
jgi:hypothetical protein